MIHFFAGKIGDDFVSKNDFTRCWSIDAANEIQKSFPEIDTRTTILGYVQRGGSPSIRDRITATEMGAKAIELIMEGKYDRVIAEHGGKIVDLDIGEALAMTKTIDPAELEMTLRISI